jgi:phosphatidylglycerophosphatase A
MRRLALLVSTCGYVGYAPVAPGTFGSAAGLVILYLVRLSGSWPVELAAIVVLFAAGVWSGSQAERHYGREDPGYVVMDEVVGMLITLFMIPATPLGLFVAFLIFRALDILKPFPAGRLEHLHGGLGIMADDAMVGVYGNAIMWALIRLLPGWLA